MHATPKRRVVDLGEGTNSYVGKEATTRPLIYCWAAWNATVAGPNEKDDGGWGQIEN